MRLTDVDALIDDVKHRYCKDCNKRKGIKRGKYRIVYEIGEAPCKACGVGDMLDELENAPTVNVPDKKVGKWSKDGFGTDELTHEAVFMAIKALKEQARADAVPVVRCKDCKKYVPCQKLPIGTSKWCGLFDRATCEMNYCGWGERREDEAY